MTVGTLAPAPGPSASAHGPRYRADIDGLRAVAVLPVVFYHFGVWPFTGGFVGVDVFFVISGFLITSVLFGQISEGKFSLIEFYDRRVRRIFPALFAVLAVTTVLALLVLFPDGLKRFGRTLTATALFGSNFEFVHKAGYFDVSASEKPLLHTWSLAVEEQYYLLFPLLLYALRGFARRRLLIALGVLLAASLIANIWAVRANPVADFFLLPFRFWELLIGGILAIGAFPTPRSALVRNLLALAGLGLIGASAVLFSSATRFPGENALLPCIGAALILYIRPGEGDAGGSAINRILAAPALVWIGLLSYSLYLWHWPIFVFAKAYAFGPIPFPEAVGLIGFSVGLAYLSLRFVERPFRGRRGVLSRRALFTCALGAIVVTALAGAALSGGDGLPGRFSADVRTALGDPDEHDPSLRDCRDFPGKRPPGRVYCLMGRAKTPPSFIYWGDSHAEAMSSAVSLAASAKGRAGYFASFAGCAPLVGVRRPDFPGCAAFNDAALKLALRPEVKLVVLVGRWAPYTDPRPHGPNDSQMLLDDGDPARASAARMTAIFAGGLEATVKALVAAGKPVVIVASVPELQWAAPETLARAELAGRRIDMNPRLAEFERRQAAAFALLERMKREYGVTILYPHSLLCDARSCAAERGGRPLYKDTNHLSAYGARSLAPLFAGVL